MSSRAEASAAELYQSCESGVSQILARYHSRRLRLEGGAQRRAVAPTTVVRGNSWSPKCLNCGRGKSCDCLAAFFTVAEGNDAALKRGHQHKDAASSTDLPEWHGWTIDIDKSRARLNKEIHPRAAELLDDIFHFGELLTDVEEKYNLTREAREELTRDAVIFFFLDLVARSLGLEKRAA